MAITTLPTPPTRSDPVNFNSRADAFLTALPTFATEANTLQADVNAKQTAAAASAAAAAASATASAASANVTAWVSGTTYAIGDNRYSPITFLTYRRKTAGAGTTDPSADNTNWQLINGTGDVDLSSTQTLTNKTFSTGSVWNGSAVPIANGGTGSTTAANAFNALKQSATETVSGVVELATASEMITGTDATRAVTVNAIRTGKLSSSFTTTSGASIGVSGLPSWVTRVTLILQNISTTASSNIYIQIGTAVSGYLGNTTTLGSSTIATAAFTTSAVILSTSANNAATDNFSGKVVLERVLGSNVWAIHGTIGESTATANSVSSYVVDNAGVATQFSLTTSAGTFDNGVVTYTWE